MKAYELIDSPEKWVNRCPRDEIENCAATAIWKAYGGDDWRTSASISEDSAAEQAYNKLAKHIGARTYGGKRGNYSYEHVADWNDTNTWETVYQTLKELDL